MSSSFRFAVGIGEIHSRKSLVERCRRIESAGFHAVIAPDHVGLPAPFPLLHTVAEATERLRVCTQVINTMFWNPGLLAREVASLDVLSEGRLELGLGAGFAEWECDAVGIAWEPYEARVRRLEATITELGRLFTTEQAQPPGTLVPVHTLAPLQHVGFGGSGPPLLVGGTGERVLAVAARHADIISMSGVHRVPGQPPTVLRMSTPAETDGRVRFAREAAGERATAVEWHNVVYAVVPATDRRAAAAELAAAHGAVMTVDEVLETPYFLIGTPAQMAEQLRASRERYGFSYVTVAEPHYEALEPVVELLRD